MMQDNFCSSGRAGRGLSLGRPLFRRALLLLTGFCLCNTSWLTAQPVVDSIAADMVLSAYLGMSEEDPVDEEATAELLDLLSNPVDLNATNVLTLTRIPFIDPLLAAEIIALRDASGRLNEIAELRKISNLSEQEYDWIQHFVTVFPRSPDDERTATDASKYEKRLSYTIVQSYGRRIDLLEGFRRTPDEGGFLGSPTSIYSRISISLGERFSFRLTLEKDPGESFDWRPSVDTYGFDHVAGSVHFTSKRFIESIILGDFTVMIGQGLMCWRNTGRGKGAEPVQDPLRAGTGMKPVASREENAFFRGAAVSLNLSKHIKVDFFYSHRRLDATLRAGADSLSLYLGSRLATGLHRTLLERSRKDAFTEQVAGSQASYHRRFFSAGIAGYTSRFSHPYAAGSQASDFFDFTGSRLHGLSLNGAFRAGGLQGFSEFAVSMPGGRAAMAGVAFNLGRNARFVVSARHFQKNYQNFYGNAFAEQRSAVRNEAGLYVAMQLQFGAGWQYDFFIDVYSHPWLKTNLYRPTSGFEYFGRLTYKPRTWFRAALTYRFERQAEGSQELNAGRRLVKSTEEISIQVVRLQLDYEFSRQFRIRSRIDVRDRLDNGRKFGAMTLQDFVWTPSGGTQIQVRFAIFDSEGGDEALYAYENDLRYRFAIRTFTGTGVRNYLLLRKRVGPYLTLEARYSLTRYGEVTTRGTGVDSYTGRLVREMNAQIIWKV